MALEGLHQLSLLHVPELDGHVRAAGDQVGRVAGELAVPHPLQVALQSLELSHLEFPVLHAGLEEAYLLVGRASGQVLVVGGKLHLQDVVLVGSDQLLVRLRHVLPVAAEKPLVVGDGHSLQGAAHRDRPHAVIHFDLHHLPPVAEVPPFHHADIIASDDRALIGVESSAIYGLIVLEALYRCASSEVEEAEVSVFAASVDEVLLLPKTSDRSDIAFEVSLVGTELLLGSLEVVDLRAVVHADDDLAFVLSDLDAVGG